MICDNCSHNCDLKEGQSGLCHARSNKGDTIVCDNYGSVTSLALDPIEKKPLAMFHPGSYILSAGSYGCNMSCPWCQNDSISRGYVEADKLTPEELVDIAIDTKDRGNIGIAYTYNEPFVGYEFVYDSASLAKEKDLVNVCVSNGMLERSKFDSLADYIDAYNIDLKTGYAKKYEKIGGDLELITGNITSAVKKQRHVELTTLVVPRFNDSDDDIERITDIISGIDPKIPLHITRFFPAGKMRDERPTDLDILYRFRDIASKKLENVFLGNV